MLEMRQGEGTFVVADPPTERLNGQRQKFAEELNHQYTLGYTPNHTPDGRYHRIRVRVKKGDYEVRARQGYLAANGLRY